MKHWAKDVFFTRRGIIAGGAGLIVARASMAAGALTPSQTAGPFYPRTKPADVDMDLTVIEGRSGRASGNVIEVSGRVLSVKGMPLENGLVEIWQADSNGRYNHPSDRNAENRDDDFQGFGAVRLGAKGDYLFRTIRPRYYETGFGVRTPHIHFRVVAPGGGELVTQMYFPGEPLNDKDGLYRSLGDDQARQMLTARSDAGNSSRLAFDLVVA